MTCDSSAIPVKDIIGNTQVRRMIGTHLRHRKPVTRATLIRYRAEGFPAPVRTIPGGPGGAGVELWDAREVRAWLVDNRPV